MKSQKPFVSVLMTAYNRERFIAEAIESVLTSTYTNFELIIVDDGSIDRTVAIAKAFLERDPRVKLFINEKNLGDYANRNRAASYAIGEFIMYVDSDDMLFSNTIDTYAAYAKDYPDLKFSIYYDDGGAEKKPYFLRTKDAIINHYFNQSSLLSGPGGILVQRLFFEGLGRFPEKYGPANDMYFNVKAASFTDVLINPIIPVFYRRHDNQESNNTYSYIFNNYRYNRDLLADLELPLSLQEKSYILKKNKRRFIVNAFRHLKNTHNFKETIKLFKKANFGLKDTIQGIFH